LAATKTGMNLETSEMLMNTLTIDGMQVTRSFNIKDKSGAILVALGDSNSKWRLMACLGLKFLVFMGLGF
jgi:hypothetical protein